MRRYTSLLLTAFAAVVVSVLGSCWLLGHADETVPAGQAAVTVYTTMPAEQAGVLAAAYEQETKVRVDMVPLTADELTARIRTEGASPRADMVLADSAVLRRGADGGAFVPFVSEKSDAVPDAFKDEDAWTGAWYDPVVFCVNSDYLRTLPRIPQTWTELAAYPNMRIGMTDFLAADAAANLYLTLRHAYDEPRALQILAQLHPKVVQYVKYLSTPVRMTGMGEVDVSVAVRSETLRYMQQGYPLKMIYPADGTSYMMTGVALLRESEDAETFADWLLGDEAQIALQRADCYVVPTNPGTLAYRMLSGKNVVLWERAPLCTAEERRVLLDKWLKEVRFK